MEVILDILGEGKSNTIDTFSFLPKRAGSKMNIKFDYPINSNIEFNFSFELSQQGHLVRSPSLNWCPKYVTQEGKKVKETDNNLIIETLMKQIYYSRHKFEVTNAIDQPLVKFIEYLVDIICSTR